MHHRLLLNEGQVFRFAYPVIRHVFYHLPSAARRQRIHQQIAQTLEQLYADHLEAHLEITHHLIRTGSVAEGTKVFRYARQAGDQAFALFAWSEAARYYEAAVSAAESLDTLSIHERAALHYWAGLAYYRDMDVGPCLDHYEKAIEAYRQTGDVQGLAQVLMEKIRAYFTQATVPCGTLPDVQPLEEILTALGKREPALRGNILATLAEAYRNAIQPDKAKEAAQCALEIGKSLQDNRLIARASFALGLAQAQTFHVREALTSWENSLISAQQSGDLWLQGWPLQRMPLVLTMLGRLEEAEKRALEASALIHQTHDWADYSVALSHLASVAIAKGDFPTAEKFVHETMMMVSRSHYP